LDNDWQGWNGGNLAPSRDLYGNLYQDKLGMPFEKFPDGDIRKKAFRVISNDGDYEGFFLMGTQYKFDYEKGYGFTDEVITERSLYRYRTALWRRRYKQDFGNIHPLRTRLGLQPVQRFGCFGYHQRIQRIPPRV
jgi:hypothetical protein